MVDEKSWRMGFCSVQGASIDWGMSYEPPFRLSDMNLFDARQVVYHGTNAHAYSEGQIEQFHTQPLSGRGGAFFSSDRSLAAQYGERVYAVQLNLKNPLVVDAGGSSWCALSENTRIDGRVPEALSKASRKQADELTQLFRDMSELFGDEPVGDGEARPKIPASAQDLAGRTLGDIPGLAQGSLETDDIVKTARKMGFDGVVFRQVQDSPTYDALYARVVCDVYVAFHPDQIKHVDEKKLETSRLAQAFVEGLTTPKKMAHPT